MKINKAKILSITKWKTIKDGIKKDAIIDIESFLSTCDWITTKYNLTTSCALCDYTIEIKGSIDCYICPLYKILSLKCSNTEHAYDKFIEVLNIGITESNKEDAIKYCDEIINAINKIE